MPEARKMLPRVKNLPLKNRHRSWKMNRRKNRKRKRKRHRRLSPRSRHQSRKLPRHRNRTARRKIPKKKIRIRKKVPVGRITKAPKTIPFIMIKMVTRMMKARKKHQTRMMTGTRMGHRYHSVQRLRHPRNQTRRRHRRKIIILQLPQTWQMGKR